MITIELFGVPRLRAGLGSVQVDAASLAAALRGLGRLCPALDGPVIAGDTLHPAYLETAATLPGSLSPRRGIGS